MINIKTLFRTVFFLILVLTVTPKSEAQFRVVGYFANWNDVVPMAKSFDYSKVTHLNYCFVNVTNNQGSLDGMDNRLDTVVKYAHNSGVKVLISMGGGAMSTEQENNYYYLISNESRRAQFIDSITNYLDRYDLDGFDMDIEGPRINSNYGAFIAQLSDSLKAQGKLLTAALGDWGGENVPHEVVPLFDFINIMSYDATGSWDQNNVGQHSSYELAFEGVEKWAARGADKRNLTIGLPFYGYAFNDLKSLGFAYYSDILNRYPEAYNQDTVGSIILYNGIPTIQQKTYLALDSAGGVMIWELAYDTKDEHSLLKAIDDAKKSYREDDLAPVAQIVKPEADTTVTTNTFSVKTLVADPDGTYRKTRFYLGDVFIGERYDSTTSFDFTNLASGTYPVVIEAFDHQFRTGNDTLIITVDSQEERIPFSGSIISLPGRIEAENFDVGNMDVTYHDASLANEGKCYRSGSVDIEPCFDKGNGYSIGWTSSGEWLEYTVNISEEGYYDFDFRAATANSGRTVSIQLDGETIISNKTITNSGGWQVWKTSTVKGILLPQGEHVIRTMMNSGGFNLNYILVRPGTQSSIDGQEVNNMHIFPNPAKTELFVKAGENKSAKVEIYNSAGQLMQTLEYNADSDTYANIDVSGLSPDVYIINVKAGNTSFSERFVKE